MEASPANAGLCMALMYSFSFDTMLAEKLCVQTMVAVDSKMLEIISKLLPSDCFPVFVTIIWRGCCCFVGIIWADPRFLDRTPILISCFAQNLSWNLLICWDIWTRLEQIWGTSLEWFTTFLRMQKSPWRSLSLNVHGATIWTWWITLSESWRYFGLKKQHQCRMADDSGIEEGAADTLAEIVSETRASGDLKMFTLNDKEADVQVLIRCAREQCARRCAPSARRHVRCDVPLRNETGLSEVWALQLEVKNNI